MQHLIVDGAYIKGSLPSILSSFPNITNLAIQGYHTNLDLQELSHLIRKLAVDSSYLFHDKSPIQNLTHLTIHGYKADSSWINWEFLAHLPKLTHINADKAIQKHVPKLLLLCPFLKLLVVELFNSYKGLNYLDACLPVDDDRLVLTVGQDYTDRILDWERGASGGVDLWINSERIVFARSSEWLVWFPHLN